MSSPEVPRGEILVISPHPDDEVIGAGGTLLRLQDAGFHIVNFAASLGRLDQRDRRQSELEEACDRAGFELIIPDEPANISSKDDLTVAQTYLADMISGVVEDRHPEVVVSPSVHDAHHGHEVVARAVRDSIESNGQNARWWMYKIWGHLQYSTIYSPFDQDTLDNVTHALDAHAGENQRNPYQKMVIGNAMAAAVFGSEKVFGFGAQSASDEPYAELLTEALYARDSWTEGEHRVLDFDNPFTQATPGKDLSTWINSPSPYQA